MTTWSRTRRPFGATRRKHGKGNGGGKTGEERTGTQYVQRSGDRSPGPWRDLAPVVAGRVGSPLAARDHLFAVYFAAQAALRTAMNDAGSLHGRSLELHSCARRCDRRMALA